MVGETKIRAAIVGPGAVARHHMSSLLKDERVRVTTIVGQSERQAADFMLEFDASTHAAGGLSSVRWDEVDVAWITSPSQLHQEHAAVALNAGVHVVVEVPFALDEDGCRDLVRLAERLDRSWFIGATGRGFQEIRELRSRIAGRREVLRSVSGFFGVPRIGNVGLDGVTRTWTDHVVLHHGSHLLDLVAWVCGPGSTISDLHVVTGPRKRGGEPCDASISGLVDDLPVSFGLTFHTTSLVWEMRFVGEQDLWTLREGRVTTERSGDTYRGTLTDFGEIDHEIVSAILESRQSTFDVGPNVRVIAALQRGLAVSGE